MAVKLEGEDCILWVSSFFLPFIHVPLPFCSLVAKQPPYELKMCENLLLFGMPLLESKYIACYLL